MSKKIIFITGVTSGVGRETARRFIKEGWKVIGSGRRQSRLDELAAELGGDFLPLCFDVAKRDVVVEMFANLPEGFKDIDVLLNNAGSSIGQNPAQSGNMDDWDEMIATNINGLLYCTRCVLPGMIERGTGHIVNIGSVAGITPDTSQVAYGTSKAAIIHLSKMIALHAAKDNITCNVVCPGMTATEAVMNNLTPEFMQFFLKHTPIARMATPQEMADAALYFATAPFTTGQVLAVHGGFGLGSPVYGDMLLMNNKR